MIDALLLEVTTQVHPFGVNEGDVVNPDKCHDLAQVRFLMIRARAGMNATASGEYDGTIEVDDIDDIVYIQKLE